MAGIELYGQPSKFGGHEIIIYGFSGHEEMRRFYNALLKQGAVVRGITYMVTKDEKTNKPILVIRGFKTVEALKDYSSKMREVGVVSFVQ